MQGINRIRLEFKARTADKISRINFVLIESDWNLKPLLILLNVNRRKVLIESDWNLKLYRIVLYGSTIQY